MLIMTKQKQPKITDFFKVKSMIKIYGHNTKTEEWYCIMCGISMGINNPRQLCGKYICYDDIK